MALDIESFGEKKQLQIDQVTAARNQVRPGEKARLNVVLAGENGAEVSRKVEYRSADRGTRRARCISRWPTAASTNIAEYRQIIGTPPKSAAS